MAQKVYVVSAMWVHGGDTCEHEVLDVYAGEKKAIKRMRKETEKRAKELRDSLGWNTSVKQTANFSMVVVTDDDKTTWDEVMVTEKEVKDED